jgi:hypothetical protein
MASAIGASGLTASFLPVQKAALNRGELYNDTTQQVAQVAASQVQNGIRAAAGVSSDVSSTALQSRGNEINLLA